MSPETLSEMVVRNNTVRPTSLSVKVVLYGKIQESIFELKVIYRRVKKFLNRIQNVDILHSRMNQFQ